MISISNAVPCHFCGNRDTKMMRMLTAPGGDLEPDGRHKMWFWMRCRECRACGPTCESQEEALEAWGVKKE